MKMLSFHRKLILYLGQNLRKYKQKSEQKQGKNSHKCTKKTMLMGHQLHLVGFRIQLISSLSLLTLRFERYFSSISCFASCSAGWIHKNFNSMKIVTSKAFAYDSNHMQHILNLARADNIE